jgi:hypothetical protein
MKFCLKLGRIALGACDELELTCREEMNRTPTFICFSKFTSWCNCTSGVFPQMFCDVYKKLSIILVFLCWTENICYFVGGAMYGWMLCDLFPNFCTPQIQSAMILFCFQNSSCTLLGEQKVTEQLDSLHYQVVKKLLPKWQHSIAASCVEY